MPDTLTLGPAARLLGVSASYLSRLAILGRIPWEAERGGRRRFAVRELELLRRRRAERAKGRTKA